MKPVMACPKPHQQARKVSTHCFVDGKYSKNTVVSRIKLPPPPNPTTAMKKPSDGQFGAAPAIMAAIEQMNREMLNAPMNQDLAIGLKETGTLDSRNRANHGAHGGGAMSGKGKDSRQDSVVFVTYSDAQ